MTVEKVKFSCKKCSIDTDADIGTKRSDLLLCSACFGKKKDTRENKLNNLSGSEWAKYSKSVDTYPDTRLDKQRFHGACFPKSLAKQQIEIYTKSGDLVMDPFVGVGTTIDAALELNRRIIGIELNPVFAQISIDDVNTSDKPLLATVIQDDANNMLEHIQPNTIDFIMTSPPYANLLRNVKGDFAYKWREHSNIDPINNPKPYSEMENDIGNMSYNDGVAFLAEIFKKCFAIQKEDTYAAWVVKDFRINNQYVNFHGDIINCAIEAGYKLWDIKIYDQTVFRPLVCLGYPSRNYYLNIGHSFILIFKKLPTSSKRRKKD